MPRPRHRRCDLKALPRARSRELSARGALIERAAVARLEISGCTSRPAAIRDATALAADAAAMHLVNGYGFTVRATRGFSCRRPISCCNARSPARGDRRPLPPRHPGLHRRCGTRCGDPPARPGDRCRDRPHQHAGARRWTSTASPVSAAWVSEVGGSGGIFTQRFAVLDNQHGCIKHSSFSGAAEPLAPNHFCVHAPDARQAFVSEWFNAPGYGQLALGADAHPTLGPATMRWARSASCRRAQVDQPERAAR